MPFLKIDTASKRERRKNGDSTNPSRVDEFTGGESKGGALTENKVRSGTRHGGAAGAQEQGLYHRLGDAAMLAPAAPPPPMSQDSRNRALNTACFLRSGPPVLKSVRDSH